MHSFYGVNPQFRVIPNSLNSISVVIFGLTWRSIGWYKQLGLSFEVTSAHASLPGLELRLWVRVSAWLCFIIYDPGLALTDIP